MKKALLYKEWLKTRWPVIAISLAGFLLHGYMFVKLGRTFRMAGNEHLWDVVINRDQFLFYDMKYYPLLAGLLLGLFQFVPEMLQKRLKLTLHLPIRENITISWMVGYGMGILLLLFSLHALVFYIGLAASFAPPFHANAFLTVFPWYIAGFAAYLACGFVCTEPTWKRRIVNIFLSIIVLRIFFISDFPGAYAKLWFCLPFLLVIFWLFIYLSVSRFKTGAQD